MRILVSNLAIAASVSLGASQALAQNLVPNGGFESGSTGWTGGTVVTNSPHAGAACLEIVDNNATSSVTAATNATIAIVPGTAYVFEG